MILQLNINIALYTACLFYARYYLIFRLIGVQQENSVQDRNFYISIFDIVI